MNGVIKLRWFRPASGKVPERLVAKNEKARLEAERSGGKRPKRIRRGQLIAGFDVASDIYTLASAPVRRHQGAELEAPRLVLTKRFADSSHKLEVWESTDKESNLIAVQHREGAQFEELASPLDESPNLFAAFAALPIGSPESIRQFATAHGSLTGFTECQALIGGAFRPAETLDRWQAAISRMRDLLLLQERMKEPAQTHSQATALSAAISSTVNVEVDLQPNMPGGAWRLSLVPDSLETGLFLQFAIALTGGSRPGMCSGCGQWFSRSDVRAFPNAKRQDAQHCSATCRKRAERRRRRRSA
jgi:hypothetical protein